MDLWLHHPLSLRWYKLKLFPAAAVRPATHVDQQVEIPASQDISEKEESKPLEVRAAEESIFAREDKRMPQRIKHIPLEDACAYLVADPTHRELQEYIKTKCQNFVKSLEYTRNSIESYLDKLEKIEAKMKQLPVQRFSEKQYYKRLEALEWQRAAVQSRIAFMRFYTSEGSYKHQR